MTLQAIEAKDIIATKLPAIDQHDEVVERISENTIRIRVPFKEEYMGRDTWGEQGMRVYSGPMVMGLADTAMYACLHAKLGRSLSPVIVSLTVNFLRPAQATDLVAEARLVRLGARLAYLETALYSDGLSEPVACVVATYAFRHPRPLGL